VHFMVAVEDDDLEPGAAPSGEQSAMGCQQHATQIRGVGLALATVRMALPACQVVCNAAWNLLVNCCWCDLACTIWLQRTRTMRRPVTASRMTRSAPQQLPPQVVVTGLRCAA
jgi:hypothetical protein